MRTPYLVQRCFFSGAGLRDGLVLRYEYMGSSEFEWGDQSKSLKRIFAAGITPGQMTVTMGDRVVDVFVVTGAGFDLAAYQPYMQRLADDDARLNLQERTNFPEAICKMLGEKLRWGMNTEVWFDFQNDILWTLDKRDALLAELDSIKSTWERKAAAEKETK